MILDRNLIELRGRVGETPKLKVTDSGRKVINMSLATKETWRDETSSTGYREKTQWHRCEAWGPLADIIEKHAQKGDLVEVYAKVEYRQNESNGVKYNNAIMVLSEFHRMDRPDKAAQAEAPAAKTEEKSTATRRRANSRSRQAEDVFG